MVYRGRTLTRACGWLALGACLAGGADRDPKDVLKRVTAKAVAAGKAIPNYTCVETVNRNFFRPAAPGLPRACSLVLEQRQHRTLDMQLRLLSTDRLRLDVAMVQRGEVFSWVGASKFDDSDLGRLVHSGPVGTGAFGAFLSVVFGQDQPSFEFAKNAEVDGRAVLEYSFSVRREDSHYKMKLNDGSWLYTAYSGRFQVDAATEDVLRMSVQTAELPHAANSCMIETIMDFGGAEIGGAPIRVATHSSQRFVYETGEEAENTTTFANCREYRGESTIKYDEGPSPPPIRGGVRQLTEPVSLSPGLKFTMELTTPISAATSAAGDFFTGKLVSTLRDPKQKVVARAGSVVEGRILRVQSFYIPQAEAIVVLKPETLEIQGSKIPFTAVRDWSQEMAAAKRQGRKSMPILIPQPGEERAGLFKFSGKNVVVAKGFRSDWQTR
jgi:hypothetical protein